MKKLAKKTQIIVLKDVIERLNVEWKESFKGGEDMRGLCYHTKRAIYALSNPLWLRGRCIPYDDLSVLIPKLTLYHATVWAEINNIEVPNGYTIYWWPTDYIHLTYRVAFLNHLITELKKV